MPFDNQDAGVGWSAQGRYKWFCVRDLMSETPVIAGNQLAAFDMSAVDRKGGLVESHFHIICIACGCKAYSCMSDETHPNANLPESTRNTS